MTKGYTMEIHECGCGELTYALDNEGALCMACVRELYEVEEPQPTEVTQ